VTALIYSPFSRRRLPKLSEPSRDFLDVDPAEPEAFAERPLAADFWTTPCRLLSPVL